MKTINSILAVTAVLLAGACAKQEPVFVHSGGNDVISFSTSATKAADITTANLQSFSVTAHRLDASLQKTTYFENVEFTKTVSGTFASAENYYWPENGYLHFYAYAPNRETIPSGQVTRLDYNKFSVVPDKTASSATQADLVWSAGRFFREDAENGSVPLTFRHAESKIRLQVKNSSSTIKIEVDGWKIGGVAGSGVFTGNGDIDPSGFLSASLWTVSTEDKTEYVQNLSGSKKVRLDGISEARMVNNNLILIPQSVTEGAYIAVKMRVTNANDDALIKGNADGSGVWSTWPLAVNWTPGRSYTYVIDLAKAPIFGDDDAIRFVDVIVRDWDEGSNGDEGTVKEEISKYILPGKFSVSSDKAVRFSRGNLYWNGEEFKLEENQWIPWDCFNGWNPYHVTHFFWSKNQANSYLRIHSGEVPDINDILFTNSLANTPNESFSIEGQTGVWRCLSFNEWKYLLEERIVNGHSGEGYSYDLCYSDNGYGLLVYPDGYTGQSKFEPYEYAPGIAVSSIPEGCLFLQMCGYYEYDPYLSGFNNTGLGGEYQSSNMVNEDGFNQNYFAFGYGYNPTFGCEYLPIAQSIRLVTE